MKTFLKVGGIALVLLAMIVAGGVGYAAAQRATDAAAANNIVSVPGSDFSPQLAAFGFNDQGDDPFNDPQSRRSGLEFIDRQAIVAAALGISVEELQAAHEAGKRLPELVAELGLDMETVVADIRTGVEAAIQQAVADGTITQEQADRLLQQIEMRVLARELIDMKAIVAEVLGMTVDELEAARADGQTLVDLAAAQGMDRAAMREAVQVEREAVINQALAEGTITQEQADWLLSHPGAGMGPRGRGPAGGQGSEGAPPAGDVTLPADSA